MKFLHLADLHIGKRLNDYSLRDTQRDALNKTIELMNQRNIKLVVISGDIYDSHDPSAESFALFDEYLSKLHKNDIKALIISGNHDQEDKLNYASKLLRNDGIYIVTNVSESINKITIEDTNFYLLPFVTKYDVRHAFNQEVSTLDEAIKVVIDKMNIDKKEKNVLVTHLACIGSKEKKIFASGSEVSLTLEADGSIGGEDIVSSSLFKDFNYVALGHIHKAMNIESNMRYPGALLKYHKDEANYKKTFTIVDTNDFSIEEVPFKPLHDVVLLEGLFDDVKKHVEYKDDFTYFKLLDEEYIVEPMAKLKSIFNYSVNISYKSKELNISNTENYQDIESVSKLDLFEDLFKSKTGDSLSDEEKNVVSSLINDVWGEN